MTLSNAIGYGRWTRITGDKLIPGFPGAGGDIKEDVLYGKFVSGKIQKTIFGEISGETTERIMEISKIFQTAKIPFEISKEIQAFHISHAAVSMANKHFYTESGMVDLRTAKSMKILKSVAKSIKDNLKCIKEMRISIVPLNIVMMKKLPSFLIMLMFYIMLSTKSTRDALLGNHSLDAKNEVLVLCEDFNDLCIKNGVRPPLSAFSKDSFQDKIES